MTHSDFASVCGADTADERADWDVIDTLAELFAMRGVPNAIRGDNGPEFVSRAVQEWLGKLKIGTLFVAPGSPWENGYAESFHSKLAVSRS